MSRVPVLGALRLMVILPDRRQEWQPQRAYLDQGLQRGMRVDDFIHPWPTGIQDITYAELALVRCAKGIHSCIWLLVAHEWPPGSRENGEQEQHDQHPAGRVWTCETLYHLILCISRYGDIIVITIHVMGNGAHFLSGLMM